MDSATESCCRLPAQKETTNEADKVVESAAGCVASGVASSSASCNDGAGDQVALITGCASGIGRGTALAFAALNYRLVLVDKQPERLSETGQLCGEKSAKNYKPLELALDLADGEQVAKQVVELTIKHFGRLDVLINNAGITALTKFDDSNCIQLYHKVISTNMHAVVYLCLAAYEPLKASKGSIVNVSSMLDDKPAKFKFAYCMSKAAVTMLTKCLANDFAPFVRVNCVSPGPIASSILDDMGIKLAERRENAKESTLIQRIGEPEDVAKMIIYLSSKEKAAFITGSRVLVDGGYTLVPHEKNISDIKLRGASFLMHQVYDDEMTFKLVVAASKVSGLPVEACLEAFGKHFLVYCQKNGYDQILRVLGSNLYDFLTNLDNLHDHLASIYPGMRAPSFRVTRHLNTNHQKSSSSSSGCTVSSVHNATGETIKTKTIDDGNNNNGEENFSSGGGGETRTTDDDLTSRGDELHKQNASCSMAGSMYLHYYSERAGLSPIVKGLVMAVAKEFFQTDIQVTVCELQQQTTAQVESTSDDHVILKIDKKTSDLAATTSSTITPEEEDKSSVSVVGIGKQQDEEDLALMMVRNTRIEENMEQSASGACFQVDSNGAAAAAAADGNKQVMETIQSNINNSNNHNNHNHNKPLETMAQYSTIYDLLSTNARDSLVNSEIMMQTFPFHVIFDRQFNIVQVGKSLLRVTSSYWQRFQEEQSATSGSGWSQAPGRRRESKMNLVKFSDLFRIIRPKIEFTFDAIADHTNQVFVVKTRPLVLNADFRRMKRLSSSGSTVSSSGSSSTRNSASGSSTKPAPPPKPMCPFDRIAQQKRRSKSIEDPHHQQISTERITETEQNLAEPKQQTTGDNNCQITQNSTKPPTGSACSTSGQCPITSGSSQQQNNTSPKHNFQQQQLDDAGEPLNHVSLRLKGQMIVLLGGQLCLYLCSPRVDDLDQLMECGVTMSDFALHDRARELMLMSHTHKEDREAVKKLDQASNDLKKMDTKLRQENKRTEEVLHNIFPAKIATLLSHGHKVESESFDLVTCLYSDIIGFTKMCGSENVRPIDIVRLLNTMYLQFDNLTNIHGVFKVETIGDAYVVVGGLPEPVEDHADRCVKMGLDMVKVISKVRSPADNQPIQMRIGIHSGPVMAGIVGIRVPRYSLFGNTTTLANQLESNGVGGKIHISDFTRKNLIKLDRFVIEGNPQEISGIPFVTYFVTNYLGDRNEMIKHEKLLEEQLIKDLELMGSELELVDDQTYQQQLVYPYENASSQESNIINKRQELVSSSSNEKNLQSQIVEQNADFILENLGEVEFVENNRKLENKSKSGRAKALGETLVENLAEDQQHYDQLILMDIEDQAADGLQLREHQLRKLSGQLSNSIISEALGQVRLPSTIGNSNNNNRARVMALLLNVQRELEVIVKNERQQQAPNSKNKNKNQCPICDGCGKLDENGRDLIRLKLSPNSGLPNENESVLVALQNWLSGRLKQKNSNVSIKEDEEEEATNNSRWNRRSKSVTTTTTTSTNNSSESLTAELRAERHRTELLLPLISRHQRQTGSTSGRLSSFVKSPTQAASISGSTTKASPTGLNQTRAVLSTEIQRIKRMDTLKCQRLKRKRQQQQQQQQQVNSTAGGRSDKEFDVMQELELELKSRQQGGRKPGAIVEEPSEEEEEEEEDDDDEGGENSLPEARVLVERPEVAPIQIENSGEVDHPIKVQAEVNERITTTHKKENEEMNNTNSNEQQTNNYQTNYQSIRSSLASLVNGIGQRAQQSASTSSSASAASNRKHRFNPFANFTSFVSPFSSPIKQQQHQQHQQQNQSSNTCQSANIQIHTKTNNPLGNLIQEDCRKQSSRSQSSGSGSNTNSGSTSTEKGGAQKQHKQRVVHRNSGSNCSCLKSSASNQSIDSASARIH